MCSSRAGHVFRAYPCVPSVLQSFRVCNVCHVCPCAPSELAMSAMSTNAMRSSRAGHVCHVCQCVPPELVMAPMSAHMFLDIWPGVCRGKDNVMMGHWPLDHTLQALHMLKPCSAGLQHMLHFTLVSKLYCSVYWRLCTVLYCTV